MIQEKESAPLILTAPVIRRLFDMVSSHLRDAKSFNHHLTIAGGAALALRWDDRFTHDVDVLEHRFRYQSQTLGTRSTGEVDFVSMKLPAEMERAASLVSEAERLPRNWLNGAVAVFAPAGDLQLEVLYRNDWLTVESPGPRILLAMKLHAGRDRDLHDASRLIREARITQPRRLLGLVAKVYGEEAVTADTARFVGAALSLGRRVDG